MDSAEPDIFFALKFAMFHLGMGERGNNQDQDGVTCIGDHSPGNHNDWREEKQEGTGGSQPSFPVKITGNLSVDRCPLAK